MSERAPRVSVVMAVHNGERHLREALDSILEQSFEDFELVVVDDGSTDSSAAIVEASGDERVRLIKQANQGLPAALNAGIAAARGEYIARHDDDDASLPQRFERQVAYLDSHREVALVGSNYTIIDEEGAELGTTRVFTHPDDLAVAEILSNQFGHGSVMIRASVLREVGGYDTTVGYVEDYDLFLRISHVAKIANLPEPLYHWRRSSEGLSLANQHLQIEQALRLRDREFQRYLHHMRDFRTLSSWHPSSYHPDARTYFGRKCSAFRDLAYLFRRDGRWFRAALMLAAAIAVGSGRRRQSARFLARHVHYRSREPVWEWEYV